MNEFASSAAWAVVCYASDRKNQENSSNREESKPPEHGEVRFLQYRLAREHYECCGYGWHPVFPDLVKARIVCTILGF